MWAELSCATAGGAAIRTGEAGRPGDVQVEVLGSVDEHVQIPVGLREQQKTTTTHHLSAQTHPEAAAPPPATATPPNSRCAAHFSNLAPLMEAKLAKQTFQQPRRRPDVRKSCESGRVVSFGNAGWGGAGERWLSALTERERGKERVFAERKAPSFVVPEGGRPRGRVPGAAAPSGPANRR